MNEFTEEKHWLSSITSWSPFPRWVGEVWGPLPKPNRAKPTSNSDSQVQQFPESGRETVTPMEAVFPESSQWWTKVSVATTPQRRQGLWAKVSGRVSFSSDQGELSKPTEWLRIGCVVRRGPKLLSVGSLRVGCNWATSLSLFPFMHWRRKWQPTPVFLPGESRDREAWWAAIYGIAQSRTRLKRLSSSSSSSSKATVTTLINPWTTDSGRDGEKDQPRSPIHRARQCFVPSQTWPYSNTAH